MKIIRDCNLTLPGSMPQISALLPLLLILCLSVLPAYSSDRPTVRVTTGVVRIDGWQGDLVKRNRNLSRWHWNPLYVYKQGLVGGNNKQAAPSAAKTASSYPSHRPVESSHYVKPAHVPFSAKALAAVAGRDKPPAEPRASETLAGKVQPNHSEKKTEALLVPAEKRVLREPSYQTIDEATVRSEAAVHGQLKEAPAPIEQLKASPKQLPKLHSQ